MFNGNKTEYVATCLFGLEKLVGEEIDALGYKRTETIDGRVIFTGDETAIARCNICMRFAERIYIRLAHFKAYSFEELFQGVKAIAWENVIGETDSFPVKGHSIKSKLFSIPDCQSIIKKAVVESLKSKYGISHFEETGIKYQIEFFIINDEASIMIDTSGVPLHKRGYRPVAGEAPLRETLAAAMVKLSRPRENVLLWDPFCGSGTIAIESALMMKNIAPGIGRSFCSEEFPQISCEIWQNARDEAKSKEVLTTGFEAYASDIDPQMIEIANENIERAGVSGVVKTFACDARDISADGRRGTIVTNPPYGERLGTLGEVRELYKEIGQSWKALDKWQIYLLCSDEEFEKSFGRRADKVRKLYNGMIKCGLFQYFKNQNK